MQIIDIIHALARATEEKHADLNALSFTKYGVAFSNVHKSVIITGFKDGSAVSVIQYRSHHEGDIILSFDVADPSMPDQVEAALLELLRE